MQTNKNSLLEIIPKLFEENEILSEETFDKIKSVVKFDNANIYMLSPEVLEKIYPKEEELKISNILTKKLFKEEIEQSKEISSQNHFITYLKVKNIVYGLVVFEGKNFSKEEKAILKAITSILSYKIKDKELSEVFKSQVKLLSKAVNETKNEEQIKTEFIANVSHELRTPLNAIIGYADLLQNKKLGELNNKQLEFINNIQTSSLHLLEMINEILDISKIEANSTHLIKQSFNISMAIDEVLNTLYPLFKQKNIKLEKNVIDFEICADYLKIKQILFNLISNAIKFTKDEIFITIQKDDVNAQISIKDNGVGIEKKNQKKIFKKFTQIKDYSIKKESSTGLGLTITNEFVKMHNGKITLESELNKGANFTVKIPLN